eukprot:7079817-Prymnesium_polylepis.1
MLIICQIHLICKAASPSTADGLAVGKVELDKEVGHERKPHLKCGTAVLCPRAEMHPVAADTRALRIQVRNVQEPDTRLRVHSLRERPLGPRPGVLECELSKLVHIGFGIEDHAALVDWQVPNKDHWDGCLGCKAIQPIELGHELHRLDFESHAEEPPRTAEPTDENGVNRARVQLLDGGKKLSRSVNINETLSSRASESPTTTIVAVRERGKPLAASIQPPPCRRRLVSPSPWNRAHPKTVCHALGGRQNPAFR